MTEEVRSRYRDLGLLILRLGIGAMFMYHGFPKLRGGPNQWLELGKAMGFLGIHFAPVFWGFMAGFAEFFGGIFLILGAFFRLFCALLFVDMLVAVVMHLSSGQGLAVAAQAIEMGVVFLSLILIGPGAYSLCPKCGCLKKKD